MRLFMTTAQQSANSVAFPHASLVELCFLEISFDILHFTALSHQLVSGGASESR